MAKTPHVMTNTPVDASAIGGVDEQEVAKESTRYAAGMYSLIAQGKDGTLFSNKVEEGFAAKEPADIVKIAHCLTIVFLTANDERYNFAHRSDPFSAWEPDKIPSIIEAVAGIDDPKGHAEACVAIYEYGESIWSYVDSRPTFSCYAVVKASMYEEIRAI